MSSGNATLHTTPGDLQFPGDGEMAGLIESFGWSKTPLGPIQDWPQSLRTVVRLILAQRFPLLLWWGPEYIQIYNDAYRPIHGAKHPRSLGQPARVCWAESWNVLQPLIDTPFHGGPATRMEDLELELNRRGFLEETHFTVAYSPVPDESAANGIGGVLATVHEITEKVIGQRRLVILHEIGEHLAPAKTTQEACSLAAEALGRYAKDVPFAEFYLLNAGGTRAELAGSAGVHPGEAVSPLVIDLPDLSSTRESQGIWPFQRAWRNGSMLTVGGLARRFAKVPQGPWADPPHTAEIVPIFAGAPRQLLGYAVFGVSSRLSLDELYRNFFEILTAQVSTAITNARAHEEERRRGEELAQLDRAKTTFFSNVSHEFRTPLTLLLGPLQELLAGDIPPERDILQSMERSALRLEKLVNTLLDFSRIEAGRVRASYEPVDLSALTAELASSFRSTMEKAGLKLIVDCAPLPEPVYVDRDMWEKIVLNFLSNALKFTFHGEVKVMLRPAADKKNVELSVRDTGTGIPASELPHLFERFHRVEGARGRTFEGTGIGLALVSELVKLHGGTVRSESEPGKGSTFTVLIPFGNAHLPSDRMSTVKTPGSSAYVGQAIRWLPGDPPEQGGGRSPGSEASNKAAILIADNNADMRDYLARLLRGSFDVTTANNGEEALTAIHRSPPELVISDVMMPEMDGFQLLREIRSHEETRTLPVILLSARAGEESRVAGIEAGADDYLVKPFSARELISRVQSHVQLERMRKASQLREAEMQRHSEEEFQTLANAIPNLAWMARPDGWVVWFNQRWYEYTGASAEQMQGWGWQSVVEPEALPAVLKRWKESIDTGKMFSMTFPIRGADGRYRPFLTRSLPVRNAEGRVERWFGTNTDVSAQKRIENALRENEQRFRMLANSAPVMIWVAGPDQRLSWVNKRSLDFTGSSMEQAIGGGWSGNVHPEDRETCFEVYSSHFEKREPFSLECRVRRSDGAWRWVMGQGIPRYGHDGEFLGYIGTSIDITDRREAEDSVRRANADLEQFAYSASHDLQEPIRNIAIYSELLAKRYENALDDKGRQYLKFISTGAQRMEMLVRDLLVYRQMTTAEPEEPVETIDANVALRKALSDLASSIRENGARVIFHDLPKLRMREVHLQQIFQNLIGNAIKYRGDRPPEIEISAVRTGGQWRFSVKDNGIGIDPKYKEVVFGIFKRLHSGAAHSGTGIGLAICQRLVERYGGRIWVDSQIGKGSNFYFTIPAADGIA